MSEIQNSSIFSLDDVNEEEMNNLIDGTITDFDEGDLVNGTVVKIEHDEVLVDIGFKSEGVIPVRELSIRKDANPADIVALGDPIEALVLQKEDKDGRLVLSKKRAEYERAWNRIEEKFNSGENVEGEVIEVVKGGLILDIGLRGFLPASLVDLRRVKDLTSYMGTRIEARVIEMDRNRNNVVLSRRVVLEESRKAERSEILSKLKSGMRLQGTVSSIVDFGAFVDLGEGIEGLVHISELANRHVENPETVVKPGEEVFVKVIDVDLDRRRISLSLKQANDSVDPASEDFDPALYGMPAEYDEQGNYKYPEGFDPNTNEWIAGYEKQREEWESQYAAAHELWEEHKAFVAKELENAAASAAEDGQAPKEEKVEETSNYSSDNSSTGTLADSDQLAALRDQLLGK